MEIISVNGIVVSSISFKENSKILNILTKEKGLIGCISKGCKNLKSKLRVISENFAYGTFHLYYKESESEEIYPILESALLKIEEGFDPKVITNIVELQYLEYIGININLDECVKCGNTKVVTLSIPKGGYICSNCRTNEPIIDTKVMKLLRLYNYVDISKISNLDIDDKVRDNIDLLINEYYEEYSGVVIKSKKFLRDLDK